MKKKRVATSTPIHFDLGSDFPTLSEFYFHIFYNIIRIMFTGFFISILMYLSLFSTYHLMTFRIYIKTIPIIKLFYNVIKILTPK